MRKPGLRHRVPAALLGGATSIHEGLLAPGELVPPHTHAHEDQCIYVVSGTVHLQVGGEFIEAAAGSYVIKPRGVAHGFWNLGRAPALALEITSPGGFESYYHDMAAAASPAQARAVQAEYGITFHGDLAPQLISRHGLHVGDIPQQWQQSADRHGPSPVTGPRMTPRPSHREETRWVRATPATGSAPVSAPTRWPALNSRAARWPRRHG